MDSLEAASREELLALVAQQHATIQQLQATIQQLEARVRELEARLYKGRPPGMPGLKPGPDTPPKSKKARKQRPHGYARLRATPTERVMHAVANCSHCQIRLVGGSVKRTREVLEIDPTPVRVIEHVYLERQCPLCGTRWVPRPELHTAVLGQQRLGVGLVSLIATLREEGRLPVRTIQWYLRTVHHLRLSQGAIVGALHRVAQAGQVAVAQVREAIRASPVVHADETGWRQNGANGYVWTFSTPSARYFVHGGRGKGMVDEVLGQACAGVLVSDFYAAYHHYPGLKQRCWAHLLQEIGELTSLFPEQPRLHTWATGVCKLYGQAKAFSAATERERVRAQVRFQQRLLRLCQPYLDDPASAQRRLCLRIQRFLSELFVFVAHPEVPPENNAAERSLRHLVTSRKISGGTRSEAGTRTKMLLSSLFGTWRAQGLDPWLSSRQLLISL